MILSRKSSRECFLIFFKILPQSLPAILHDKPWMLDRVHAIEEAVFLIQRGKDFLILSSAKENSYIAPGPKSQLVFERLDDISAIKPLWSS